jgi:hypothetical protein
MLAVEHGTSRYHECNGRPSTRLYAASSASGLYVTEIARRFTYGEQRKSAFALRSTAFRLSVFTSSGWPTSRRRDQPRKRTTTLLTLEAGLKSYVCTWTESGRRELPRTL